MRKTISITWAIISLLLVGVFGYWITKNFETMQMRDQLSNWIGTAIGMTFLLMIIGICFSWRKIIEIFSKLSRYTKFIFGGIIFLAIILVGHYAPRTNRIYFDEHIYLNIAQSLAWTNKAVMCMECKAEYGEYILGGAQYNKQPNGFPFFVSLFFRVFGVSEWVAHCTNNIAYLIGVLAVFGIGLLLFRSERVALFSAAFFAFTPLVVIWSATASAETTAATFAAVAIFATALYVRQPSISTLLFAVGAVSFGITFRPESILLFLPVSLMLLFLNPQELLRERFWWGVVLLAILSLPSILHLHAVRMEDWGSSGEKFAWSIFRSNVVVNGPFYLKNVYFPAIVSLLMFFGFFVGCYGKEKFCIFVWLLYSFGVFLFFYAGSYEYGADDRFSLISAAPIAIFAGIGASWFSELRCWKEYSREALIIMVLVLLGLWSKFLPYIRAVGGEAAQARADVEFARMLAKYVPPDSIVLAHDPSMWLLWNKNSGQLASAKENKEHIEKDLPQVYRGGIYVHWNYWCNVPDPAQNAFCNYVRDTYDLKLVKEYKAFQYHYSLYRLRFRNQALQGEKN